MTEKEMLIELQNKDLIKRKLHDLAKACDRVDHDLLRTVLTADAVVDLGPEKKGNALDVYDKVLDENNGTYQTADTLSNAIIKFDGDTAASETVGVAFKAAPGEGEQLVFSFDCCRYLDRWVCVEGNWMITERIKIIDISNIFPSYILANQQLNSARDKTDPTYRYF